MAPLDSPFPTNSASPLLSLSDEDLLDRLQRGAFAYLRSYTDPKTGLVADTSRPGAPASIAVVGFALSCYPVAVERGWIDRRSAAEITLTALRFFATSEQSEAPNATGFHGFYYHFLDMSTGRRVWQCEISVVDTALLIAGVLSAAMYFDGDGNGHGGGNSAEAEIRRLAEALYRRVDWPWAQNGGETVTQGWKPECGFLREDWEGYNEATIVYLLAIGSPTFPLPPESFAGWTATYQWENMLNVDLLYAGPLFTHLFSHAWIDYRGIQDAFMREKQSDYFINTRQAVALQREYCARNPNDYVGYDRDLWGISAGDGPSHTQMGRHRRDLRVYGYMARGVPLGPDDGTLAPWAMLATVPFNPNAALRGTRRLLELYPEVCREDRLVSGFNPTYSDAQGCWLSEGWYGLDQGLLVMMLENHRSGLNWRLMRKCQYVRDGLGRAGFAGAWLGQAS